MKPWALLAPALLLAACAGETPPAPAPSAAAPPPASAPLPTPDQPTTAAQLGLRPSEPVSPPPAPPPPAPLANQSRPPAPGDQCGAAELASLIGQPRTAIPIPVDPSRRRVVCTTCPRTEELRPDRQTIEYDAATGRVTKVGCN